MKLKAVIAGIGALLAAAAALETGVLLEHVLPATIAAALGTFSVLAISAGLLCAAALAHPTRSLVGGVFRRVMNLRSDPFASAIATEVKQLRKELRLAHAELEAATLRKIEVVTDNQLRESQVLAELADGVALLIRDSTTTYAAEQDR